MSKTDAPAELLVKFPDGTIAGWLDGDFFGDERRVARAIVNCEAMFFAPLEDGFVMANDYSIEGAALAIIGTTDLSGVAITSSRPVVFRQSVLAATIGTWH